MFCRKSNGSKHLLLQVLYFFFLITVFSLEGLHCHLGSPLWRSEVAFSLLQILQHKQVAELLQPLKLPTFKHALITLNIWSNLLIILFSWNKVSCTGGEHKFQVSQNRMLKRIFILWGGDIEGQYYTGRKYITL